MKMNVIFDLDGTLIDSSNRMYILFNDLAPAFEFKKEEYWKLKRNGISHKMLFDLEGKSKEYYKFNNMWLDKIESLEYLQYDKLYPNVIESLETICVKNKLVLLTARQYKDRLIQELRQFGLLKYFLEILVASQNNKEDLLKKFLIDIDNKESTIYVSDMGKDVVNGRKMKIKTIAVTYGFMCEDKLIDYKPDYLVNSINLVVDIIMRLSS